MAHVRQLLAALEAGRINRGTFALAVVTLQLRGVIEKWEAREATYEAKWLLSNGQRAAQRKAVA